MALATIQFRGIGGDYLIAVQADNELACAATWLQATMIAANYAAIGARVYPGWPPETATLLDTDGVTPLAFITYRFKSALPDKWTQGPAGSRSRVAWLLYEVLVWQQGESFAGLDSVVAGLVTLLDIGPTDVTGGHIDGAQRYSPTEGSYSIEG